MKVQPRLTGQTQVKTIQRLGGIAAVNGVPDGQDHLLMRNHLGCSSEKRGLPYMLGNEDIVQMYSGRDQLPTYSLISGLLSDHP